MKNTKRSMLVSGLCLLLTAVMLMGSTFAWFTDSVTNEGNQIQSGTLDISLNNGDKTTLFSSENFLFEPGRSQTADLAINNEGSLWLKYTMSFANVKVTDSKAGSNADITEVLDVYKVAINANSLEGAERLGTMKELMAAGKLEEEGVLAPKGYTGTDGKSGEAFTLVIKMQESADNRYQGCGVTFDVVVNATQYNHEEDGFGNPDYDKDVTYIPDSVQEMAADLDVVSGAGTGPVGEVNTNVNTGASHAWFAPYASQAAIDYVVGFDNGEFVVRVKPNKIEGTTLSYVITNIRGENTTTDTTAKFEFPGQNSGHHEIVNYFTDMGNGWYEFRASTYGMGEEVGYIINVGYANTHGQKGEAYIRAGAGWNWDAYVQVPNECNTTKVVEVTQDTSANGAALIQAITDAAEGDTIYVPAGTYTLNDLQNQAAGLSVSGITLNKALTIVGAENGGTVIDIDGAANVRQKVFTMAGGSEGTVFRNLTFAMDFDGRDSAAIYFNDSYDNTDASKVTKIENVKFIGQETKKDTTQNVAVLSASPDGGYVEIRDCSFQYMKYAMYFNEMDNLVVENNTFDNTLYGGIIVAADNANRQCDNITIQNNKMTNISTSDLEYVAEYDSGIAIGENATNVTIEGNDIEMMHGKGAIYKGFES